MRISNLSFRTSLAVLPVLFSILTAGCSGKPDYAEVEVHPASGRVMVNGEPAYGAQVSFHPAEDVGITGNYRPFATVGKDGTFQVSTYNSGDGAPTGDYIVTIIWPENPNARGPSPDRLKGKYATPEKSDLKVTIHENNTLLPPWDLKL